MKTCSKCHQTKDTKEFSKKAAAPDGLQVHCKVCCAAYSKTYRKTYRKSRASYDPDYYEANKERLRSQMRDYQARYRKNNLAEARAKDVKSKCGNAAPSWLTDEHDAAILAVYEEAKDLGFQVDHVVPKTHPLVSGLHVEWNLQALPAADNNRKQNYLPNEPQFSFIHEHDGKAYDIATKKVIHIT